MSGNTTRTYYWDACVFFAWVKDEQRPENEMQGVREHIELLKKNEIRIFTSALTLCEVRSGRLSDQQMDIFERVLQRRNLGLVDVDRRIARRAAELKNYYGARRGDFGDKTLSTPDAIHLATAIIYSADAFHTFDGSNRKKTLGLLPLDANVGGYPLRICRPPPGPQLPLLNFNG